ncbi:MAG: hypothetical protein ACK56I_02155, partial [bacterium]
FPIVNMTKLKKYNKRKGQNTGISIKSIKVRKKLMIAEFVIYYLNIIKIPKFEFRYISDEWSFIKIDSKICINLLFGQ